MNWVTFLILLFIATILEMSLFDLLEVANLRPSAVATIALFIALWAPRMTACWATLVCGIAIDLTSGWVYEGGQVAYLIGPHALGYALAGALILQVRSMVMKRQVIAIAILTGVFVIMSSIVIVAVAAARSWYSPEFESFSPAHELLRRLGMAGYSAVVAIPLGWVLLKMFPLWRFPASQPTSTSWR